MKNKDVDYDIKGMTDINRFYPDNLKNDFIIGLNETVFNRFLTKQDHIDVVGGIGDESSAVGAVRNVHEENEFKQKNQLQAVLKVNTATETISISWEDFVRQLESQDVDVSAYDRWGKVTQFNWVPPINLDKFINFRSYYWDTTLSSINEPDYITIKNRRIDRETRFQQLTKTVSDILLDGFTVTGYDNSELKISVSGKHLVEFTQNLNVILKYVDGTYQLTKILAVSFNINTSSTDIILEEMSDKSVSSIISTELKASRDPFDLTIVRIQGRNLTQLFTNGYVFSVSTSNNTTNHYVRVLSSEFDPITGVTIVSTTEVLPANISVISLSPMLFLSSVERYYESGFTLPSQYSTDTMYKILWLIKENKINSSFGLTSVAQSILVDNTVDFLDAGVISGDILSIMLPNGVNVNALITGVTNNSVDFETDDNAYIFSFSGLQYSIHNEKSITDFLQEPTSPVSGTIWLDAANDAVKVMVSGVWVVKEKNFSILDDLVKNRKLIYVDSDWSLTNSWIHRSQLISISDKIRAQAPIIEFDDTLQLSDMVKVTYDWSYRPSEDVSYSTSLKQPTTFELFNIQQLSVDSEFVFQDTHTIVLSSKYGNIVDGASIGSSIVLSGFTSNNGIYEIVDSQYIQLTPTSSKKTVITVREDISSITDAPIGSSISPRLTSKGDKFVSSNIHWRYDGINNTVSTSERPEKNDIYSVLTSSSTTSKSGFNWQSFSFVTGGVLNPSLQFNIPLHSFCLYDDYQEGDIRVYINKKRQYGNFIELPSYADDRYVGGIQFVGGVVLGETDVVLVEVGEYANVDAGKKSIIVNTASGYELTNLSTYKKHEQLKSTSSQHPEFVVVDSLHAVPHETSSKIFSYVEDFSEPFNPYIKKHLAIKNNSGGKSFVFKQHLLDGDKILAYQFLTTSGIRARTIWRVGDNFEKYLPSQTIENVWDIPNNWYYNFHHENREVNSYVDLYTHFSSIIQSQRQPGLSADVTNSYFADSSINYGLGGTIKDHNGNLDLLVSAAFNPGASVEELVNFAKQQYESASRKIENIFADESGVLFNMQASDATDLIQKISSAVINIFEENATYKYWFGDSSSFDGESGVRNWVLTLPMMGLVKPVKPYKLVDSNKSIFQIVHHDGHMRDIVLSASNREQIFSKIISNRDFLSDTVTNNLQPFPTFIGNRTLVNGDYLIRTNTVQRTRTLYRFNGVLWEIISLVNILMDCLVEVERRLYDVSIKLYKNQRYDFLRIKDLPNYAEKREKQFNIYMASSNIINPLSNKERFSSNNPFTWNYLMFLPTSLPTTNTYLPASDWRKVYSNVFGTPYPHLEPWKIQGYDDKPDWWDDEYRTNNTFIASMWQNILDGIIPSGHMLPDGTISNGTVQVQTYTYLPVVTVAATTDGFLYGELLPPYWNSANNSGSSSIRSLFDPNAGDVIVSPDIDFTFGNFGDFEYKWSTSLSHSYDMMISAFKLDPLQFVSDVFGYDKHRNGCLELHNHDRKIDSGRNLIFHGEAYNDNVFVVHGINQWYINFNRINGLDIELHNFNNIWRNLSMVLSYDFGSLVDIKTFELDSQLIDLSEKDYSISLDTATDVEIKVIDAINLTLLSAPSKYLGDVDRNWTIDLSTLPENKREIKFFGVQNYESSKSGNEFHVMSDTLKSIQYASPRRLVQIDYGNTLRLTDDTGIIPGNLRSAVVIVDGINTTVEVSTTSSLNVSELLDVINGKVVGAFFAFDMGNINFVSTDPLVEIAVIDTDLFSSIPNYISVIPSVVTPSKFENVLIVDGNKTIKYNKSSEITVSNSIIFNGVYTISSVVYDVATDSTLIEVNEDVILPSEGILVDGVVTNNIQLGLPEDWVTGTEVYFNSDGVVSGISLDRPYYIIRIDDNTFSIAESASLAIQNRNMILAGVTIEGTINVGKLERTFKVSSGASAINWRIHAIDSRKTYSTYDGVSITGLQKMIDWLHGYSMFSHDNGFIIPNSNNDNDTGRPFSWDLYIEKFLDWALSARFIRQQNRLEYRVTADNVDSSFDFGNINVPNWATGTVVILVTDNGATLPSPFTASNTVNIPYYVVRTSSSNSIKLAATAYDANKGIFIKFSQPSIGGVMMQVYEKYERSPQFLFAPFAESLGIIHDRGITSNIFTEKNYVYGIDGNKLDSSQIFTNRKDSYTEISILGLVRNFNINNPDSRILIGGARVGIQNIGHILTFNDYTLGGDLIYDPFLGLRTPRFTVQFRKQRDGLSRPTIGGYVLNGNQIVQNIESAIDDSRYYYDDILSNEGNISTNIIRKTLGYDGPKDYMSDINIRKKSQFLFWKSMIQNKGTNFAVSAFTNQVGMEGHEIDEFWAYKLSNFGGNEKQSFPEMRLLAQDANRNELRIEFIPPNNTVLDPSFEGVSLIDADRWWSQPDQIEAVKPYDTFFFDTKVNSITNNAESKLVTIQNKKILVVPVISESAIVTHIVDGEVTQLTEQTDFSFINSRMIEFTSTQDPTTMINLTVATITYDFDTHNPAKIIDRKAGSVISNIPFWNPAVGQYDLEYTGPIDSISKDDLAHYTNKLDSNFLPPKNSWFGDKTGHIWLDIKTEGFVPYYDKSRMPNIDDRIFNWGKVSEWSNIEVYQWTVSKYSPEEWEAIAKKQQNNYSIPDQEQISGTPRKILYKNTSPVLSTPIWVAEEDVHVDVISGLMDETNSPSLFGNIDVYMDGKYSSTKNIQESSDYLFIQDSTAIGTYLHFTKRAHIPTSQEIQNGLYVYSTPYSLEQRINPSSGKIENIYYYWVSNKMNVITVNNVNYTLGSIRDGIVKTTSPYMIVQGLRVPGSGFGLVYGNIFDEFGFNLPYRYTQLVIKGLNGLIRDNSRYTMRFMRDHNLRDGLDKNSLSKKNVHAEWKLFRERQSNKIDRYLWDKLIESLIGHPFDGTANFDTTKNLPSFDRIVYDNINNTDTRIGLGEGQILVDPTTAKSTIRSVIEREIFDSVGITVKNAITAIDYSTPESTIISMNELYEVLDAQYLNKIFFAVLHDAMAMKSEYSEIFKTSWVGVQVSQLLEIPDVGASNVIEHNLIIGEPCNE